MKIVLVGSGTGGHFYPLIAIAEAIHDLTRERRLIEPQLFHIAPAAYDEEALFANQIRFIKCPAGKMGRYISFQNVLDLFASAWGLVCAFFILLRIYPDVIVSKGGYASVPVTMAAHLLGIPVVVHESDVHPGRANLLAAKFAERIAISFDESIPFFPKGAVARMARTGIPIRKDVQVPETEGAKQYLGLDQAAPTIFILGGSSGAERINSTIMDALPELVSFANVIHQTGKAHLAEIEKVAALVLKDRPNAARYHPFPFLNTLSLRRAAGAADLVVSRAGATAIAEIALWHKPSILIPIPESISHDQRTNAYAYAHTGAGIVIEETNLSPHLLVSEVKRVLTEPGVAITMSEKAAGFGNADAGRILAEEAIRIALSHDAPMPEATS